MNAPENVFMGDPTKLSEVDIDAPAAKAKAATCEYYPDHYSKAAKGAEERGEKQKAGVYRFVQVICTFHPSFDTPAQPFVPMWEGEGKRSPIPADLTRADIETIRQLAPIAKNGALRARLHDVLWELTKDHKAGAEAARCYAKAADELNNAGDWTFAATSFKRAVYLASRFGRDKPVFEQTATLLQDAARKSVSGDDFHCAALMRLMLATGIGEPTEFAQIASSKAIVAAEKGDTRRAKAYFEIEADWQKRAGNAEAEKKARLAAGEAAVNEATSRSKGPSASYMAAAGLLAQAIEEMRRAGATKERITELRKQLNEWQERSLDEFQTFSTEADISDLVRQARDHVRGHDFLTALIKLAFGQGLSDPKCIKEEVTESARRSPLSYLMGAAIVDQQGRTTARKESILNLRDGPTEEAMEAESFSHAAQYHWPLRAQAFIEPARVQILNDHKPTFDDIAFIVRNNPFVPPGHAGIFLEGLHAGFHGNFLIASHLLTPQIENSLRYVLESSGVDVSNLMSDGTQPVKILGAIFGVPETKQIFGDPLCFELRGCLIEKTGYDFRNRVAHGFVTEAECYSTPGLTVWWLVLRICLFPIFRRLAEQQQPVSDQAKQEEPTSKQAVKADGASDEPKASGTSLMK
jgi:hypothetical protein